MSETSPTERDVIVNEVRALISRDFVGLRPVRQSVTTVPASSQSGRYLLAVAEHGHCTCAADGVCSEAEGDGAACRLCAVLDLEWPCPALDEDADYPDPDRVKVAD